VLTGLLLSDGSTAASAAPLDDCFRHQTVADAHDRIGDFAIA
jgi:hypothetical protein